MARAEQELVNLVRASAGVGCESALKWDPGRFPGNTGLPK